MKKTTLIALLALFAAAGAQAAVPYGFRGGLTSQPDQFHVGAHTVVSEPFAGVDLQPGIDIGFGDNVTLVSLNGDLIYRFTELETADWGFYVGGSLGLYYLNWDSPGRSDGSESELGATGLGGIIHKMTSGNEVFLELRLNIVDAPDLKLTAGINFF